MTQESKMNFFSLCLMTVFLSICDGDLVFSDFGKNKHWLVKDDLKLLKEFATIHYDERGLYLKARNSEDGLVIYILYEKEIKMFTVSKDGKVSESGNLTINSKSRINAFDVRPSGKFVVMSSENKFLYSFSQEDNKLSKLLESDYSIEDILIHPTKRQVYYSTCSSNRLDNFLFVYDLDSKKVQKQLQLPTCFQQISIDFKENIIWASAGRSISMLNMSSGLVETISNDQNDFIVSGSESLFVLQFEYEGDTQTTSILKLPKKTLIHKQKTLQGYNIQPALSHFKGATPVLFNVDEGFIEILDDQFAKTTDKIKVDIPKKTIKSIRSINDARSTTFFWIHDPNEGEVEYVQISHENKPTKRGTFKLLTKDGALENLADFDVYENEFYLATNNGLFVADYSKPELNLRPLDRKYGWPIEALGIQKKQKELVVFDCSMYNSAKVKDPFDRKNSKFHDFSPCPKQFLFDDEVDRLVVATSTGLFNFRLSRGFEQIYSGRDIRNFVLDKEFVYFVSKNDGPGIYKVAKRRTVKLNHGLQIDKNVYYRIAYVQEMVEKENKKDPGGGTSKDDKKEPGGGTSKDDKKEPGGGTSKGDKKEPGGGDSKDDKKDPGGGTSKEGTTESQPPSVASETTSPGQMFLVLLLQFVVHLLP